MVNERNAGATRHPPDSDPGRADAAWPLNPAGPEETRSSAWDVARLFGAGALGGALTLASLGVLATPTHTRGATRDLQVDRELRRECLRRGITPEELPAERDAACGPTEDGSEGP